MGQWNTAFTYLVTLFSIASGQYLKNGCLNLVWVWNFRNTQTS